MRAEKSSTPFAAFCSALPRVSTGGVGTVCRHRPLSCWEEARWDVAKKNETYAAPHFLRNIKVK
ncbi:MAG: hypothetical protein R2825_29285 [Saprospiraceae bacterium]